MNIIIFATAVYTDTLTGGDRVFVECAKRWIADGHSVKIVTNEAGEKYCEDNGIPTDHIVLWPTSGNDRYGVYVAMAMKAVDSFYHAFRFSHTRADIIFASSFFFPDMFPAFLMKLRYSKSKLAVACYLFSTKLFGSDYSGGRLKGFLFYLNEVIAFTMMKYVGNALLTASAYDRDAFIRTYHFPASRVMAVRGGVDNELFAGVPVQPKQYDAIYVGRLHPQKCVDELIEIWAKVAAWDASRTLAIVGGGLMENKLRALTRRLQLEKNVLFLGSHDGVSKIRLLKSSLLILTASRYDSGNIALDEGLAAGLPGIIYDLPRLAYPRGVIKIPVGNHAVFVESIQALLINHKKRHTLSSDALTFAHTIDWNTKAKELLAFLQNS